MGRLHVETIQIDPALLRRTADGTVLTPEILADYAARLRAQGRREDSVRSCERVLRQFYDFLSAVDTLVGDCIIEFSASTFLTNLIFAQH